MSHLPGRILYHGFHRPRRWLLDWCDVRAGRRGAAAMRAAAATLPPARLPEAAPSSPSCRFLTGARFVHQTIFCAQSFEWACSRHQRLEIFSDGTLGPAEIAALRHALPHATLADREAVARRLEATLPAARFPLLRAMRDRQPLMRKLLDLQAGLSGPALYLDSDMLFFRPPVALRDWLAHPAGGWFMQQEADALVGPRDVLERTCGHRLLPGVNSGIVATHGESFDWPALEEAAARLGETDRNHMWAEQTLFACHLSRTGAAPLPRRDYVLCNSRQDFGPDIPSLRHYVHKAKSIYAAREWRRWLELSRTAPAASTP